MPDRHDLSPYFVHLTRDDYVSPTGQTTTARQNLLDILKDQRIEARTPYGIAEKHLVLIGCTGPAFTDCQRVSCFTETPLAELTHLIQRPPWCKLHFRPYGIVFARDALVLKGGMPVWYVNQFSGKGINFPWLTRTSINPMIDAAAKPAGVPDPARWQASEIAKATPFWETMGVAGRSYRGKDFSWEREWRYRGDFNFAASDMYAIIVPAGEVETFKRDLTSALGLPRAALVASMKFVEVSSSGASVAA